MPYRLFITAALFCTLAVASIGQSQAYQIQKMGNGLTVIVEEDHTVDLVGVDVWVKAGSGGETAKINGISHMIEHLLYGATNKRKAGDMDLEMESVGASLDAHTSRDWAHYNTTVATRNLAKALDVLHDAVANAQFPEDDINRERLVILDEIAKKQSTPFMMCKEYLAKEIYGNHPYALPVEGTSVSVKAITRQGIIDYHRAHYVPSNMAVVIVGDINLAQAVSAVGLAFQGSAGIAPPTRHYQIVSPPEKQVNKILNGPYKHTYLALGFLGPRAADSNEVCAMDVLLSYLGFGYRGWMSDTLKGKMGLAIDTSEDFLTQNEPAMISLMASTTEANTEKAKLAIIAEIERLRKDGLTDGQLQAAKRSLLGQYAFESETFAGRANSLGFYFAASEPEFSAKYNNAVQSVTNEDIIKAANKYLDPDHAVILVLGPAQGGAK